QIVNRLRARAEAVTPVSPEMFKLLAGGDLGNAPVGLNSQRCITNIANRNERRDALIRTELGKFGFVGGNKIEPDVDIDPKTQFLALDLRHGLFEQLAIQIEPDRN